MSLKSNKTPGCDGLSLDFYRKFYKDMKHILLDLYRHCHINKKLHPSARRGVLNLIPKAGKINLLK